MPSSGILGSYGSFIPSFLRNFHTILHSQSPRFDATSSLSIPGPGEPGGS